MKLSPQSLNSRIIDRLLLRQASTRGIIHTSLRKWLRLHKWLIVCGKIMEKERDTAAYKNLCHMKNLELCD